MGTTRFDIVRVQELKALIEELGMLWALSKYSFGKPTLHTFARGLIFSEKIIQILEEYLPDGYHAGWGQIVDAKSGNYLSNECDVIIYKGKKPYKEWGSKAIKFIIVSDADAKVVIQCTTSVDSITKEHKEFCRGVKKFVPEIWYFAECCLAGSKNRVKQIEKDLKKVGYCRFFHLYRVDFDNIGTKYANEDGWRRFINLLHDFKK